MTTISREEVKHVRKLFSAGASIKELYDAKLYKWCSLYNLKRVCWQMNSGVGVDVPPYIDDVGLRAKKIAELTAERGKSYAQHLYLGYLKGEVTQVSFESAYIEAARMRSEKYAAEKLQREIEWGA